MWHKISVNFLANLHLIFPTFSFPIVRNNGGNNYSCVSMPSCNNDHQINPAAARTEEEHGHFSPSTMLPAASLHGDSNGSTTTASSSSGNRATNRRNQCWETTAKQVSTVQGEAAQEQPAAQNQPRKPRFVWTLQQNAKFSEAYKEELSRSGSNENLYCLSLQYTYI